MGTKLDMKTIQHMNLFVRITRVKAKHCFTYNSTMFFTIDKPFLGNVRREDINQLEKKLNKRIKIIYSPRSKVDLKYFISRIVPYRFKRLSLSDDCLTIFVSPSNPRTRSIFIGRNKSKLKEISSILEEFFGIKKVLIR